MEESFTCALGSTFATEAIETELICTNRGHHSIQRVQFQLGIFLIGVKRAFAVDKKAWGRDCHFLGLEMFLPAQSQNHWSHRLQETTIPISASNQFTTPTICLANCSCKWHQRWRRSCGGTFHLWELMMGLLEKGDGSLIQGSHWVQIHDR